MASNESQGIPTVDRKAEIGINVSVITQGLILAVILWFGKSVDGNFKEVNKNIKDVYQQLNAMNTDSKLILQRLIIAENQIKNNVDDLDSRKNIRWNEPDMLEWIEKTEGINAGWRGATPKNNHK